MMTFTDFRKTVGEMRENQKAFFKAQPGTRERNEAYRRSRELERKVDKALADYAKPGDPNGLFDEGGTNEPNAYSR